MKGRKMHYITTATKCVKEVLTTAQKNPIGAVVVITVAFSIPLSGLVFLACTLAGR